MARLVGKVAVITGGSSGIGPATARRFVGEGAHVFMVGRRQAELDKAKAPIGDGVSTVAGDVTVSTDLDRLFATDLNARATLFTVQKALPLMRTGGSVILIGSVADSLGAEVREAELQKSQLREWMKPVEAPVPRFLAETGHKGVVYREPHGVAMAWGGQWCEAVPRVIFGGLPGAATTSSSSVMARW